VLENGRSAQVEGDELVPDVTTPEEAIADLYILVGEVNGSGVLGTVHTYPEMVDEPERNAAVDVGLCAVSKAALLGAE